MRDQIKHKCDRGVSDTIIWEYLKPTLGLPDNLHTSLR